MGCVLAGKDPGLRVGLVALPARSFSCSQSPCDMVPTCLCHGAGGLSREALRCAYPGTRATGGPPQGCPDPLAFAPPLGVTCIFSSWKLSFAVWPSFAGSETVLSTAGQMAQRPPVGQAGAALAWQQVWSLSSRQSFWLLGTHEKRKPRNDIEDHVGDQLLPFSVPGACKC